MKQMSLTRDFGLPHILSLKIHYYNGEAWLENESDKKYIKKKIL